MGSILFSESSVVINILIIIYYKMEKVYKVMNLDDLVCSYLYLLNIYDFILFHKRV